MLRPLRTSPLADDSQRLERRGLGRHRLDAQPASNAPGPRVLGTIELGGCGRRGNDDERYAEQPSDECQRQAEQPVPPAVGLHEPWHVDGRCNGVDARAGGRQCPAGRGAAGPPPGGTRRQAIRRFRSSHGTEVQSRKAASTETGCTSTAPNGSAPTSVRAKNNRPIPSTRTVNPRAACSAGPAPGRASSPQACWYIRCIRRVSETPEKTRRKALSTPVTLSPECSNSLRTSFATSPLSLNLPMMAAETAFRWSAGASAPTRSSSGMSAVNA